MCPPRAAPPAADRCLDSSYTSRKQRGGTIVDETIVLLAAYLTRLFDPGSLRPPRCRCGCPRLHLHDRRERRLRGSMTADGQYLTVQIVVFICSKCSATWRVLPAFLARNLWRSWLVVASILLGTRQAHEPVIPERTRQRWRARWAKEAKVAMQVLASSRSPPLVAVAQRVGLQGCRQALFEAFAAAFPGTLPLGSLAALLHRLAPGIRLV
jgi:hypothetical protein